MNFKILIIELHFQQIPSDEAGLYLVDFGKVVESPYDILCLVRDHTIS